MKQLSNRQRHQRREIHLRFCAGLYYRRGRINTLLNFNNLTKQTKRKVEIFGSFIKQNKINYFLKKKVKVFGSLRCKLRVNVYSLA